MTNVSVLIVEEDLNIALALEIFVLNMGYTMVAVINDPAEVLCIIRNNAPDLIFAGISIKPESHFTELIQQICSRHIPIVFIPMLKTPGNDFPVGKQNRVPPAMSTLVKFFGNTLQTDSREDCTLKNSIFLRKGYSFFKVPFDSIVYIKADGDYCEFQTVSGKFIHKITLTRVVESLPRKYFLRVHKSYVVHLQHIENVSLSKNEITVNTFSIPVSKTYKTTLLNCIQRIQ